MEGLGVTDGEFGCLQGRSVLVTGHTGFKGSWLSIWLHRIGAAVTGYALEPPTQPSLFEVAGVERLLARHVVADIRHRDRLWRTIETTAPEVVFHLAAQSTVREGFLAPVDTFEVNVVGTLNLLEGVRRTGRRCAVVVITSDKCYRESSLGRDHREDDPLGGDDPYSASKGAAELVVTAYQRSFFQHASPSAGAVSLASARAGNAIGGGDWARDRIVPDLIRALVRGRSLGVRNPSAVRPWQHVLEPLSGYLTLATRMLLSDDPRWSGPWNFAPVPGDEVTVAELVGLLLASWGDGEWRHAPDPAGPRETPTLRLSIDKAVEQLGWRPRWSLRDAVERITTWHRAFERSAGTHMLGPCLEDIAAYESSPALGPTAAATA